MSLATRLSAIELKLREKAKPATAVRLFFEDELTVCERHRECDVVLQTGEHLPGILRLTWDAQ